MSLSFVFTDVISNQNRFNWHPFPTRMCLFRNHSLCVSVLLNRWQPWILVTALIIVMSPLQLRERDPCSPRCHRPKPWLYIWIDEMFVLVGGGGWEFVSAWIRGRGNTDCLRFCSCLANSRSFPHSHSSHTEQRETVAPSRRVKHDFLPFPPCSSAGWRKCISVRLTCQMEEIWMWHWRRWAASYEGPGDEAWRYGLLSGVENEVERSSRKRKAFPSGEQRHWANSILGQLCNVLVSLGLRTFQRWS